MRCKLGRGREGEVKREGRERKIEGELYIYRAVTRPVVTRPVLKKGRRVR